MRRGTKSNNKHIVKQIVETTKIKHIPERIILFGSYADGKATAKTDIDLLIIKRTKKLLYKRWAEFYHLVFEVGRSRGFSPIVITPLNLEKRLAFGDFFLEEIIRIGEVLYGA